MSGIVAVVPGRMASSRFPGKMLANETGTPLIVHCATNAARASRIDRVCIASDSAAIARAAEAAGLEHFMTREDHPNGTSRIAQIADALDADVIVNVQGDEPELPPGDIDATIAALEDDAEAAIATAAAPMTDPSQWTDPNVVKVVLDARRRAMFFSRAPIPVDRDGPPNARLRHVGLYVYTPVALADYVALPPGLLEKREQLEQLRLLEHGRPIAVAQVKSSHPGIDTPEQYAQWLQRRD